MTPYFFCTLLYVLIPTICFASTLKEYQELRFSDAYSIRLRTDVSLKEQQYAVELLVHATGFRITQPHSKDLSRLQNLGKRLGPVKTQGVALDGVEGVEVAEEGYVGGLRELAKVFQEGYGVDLHFNLSAALFSRAAQLGDSEAQAHMGQRHALGLASPRSWSPGGIRSFHQADEEQAILNYYFAAMGGNGMARMALGYRHLRGIGVPKSCWTAATYYQPVAEKVADLSTRPEALPLIERIRLHVQSAQGLQADRQREVVQYYQYSADKGNVDAQTAVAQVLNFGTYGVQRDHAQAMHYFERAAAAGDVDAMAHLGHMFANGYGAKKSYETAFSWLKLAADKESASGQFGLACLYLYGHHVEEDQEMAYKLMLKAAGQGHAEANFFIGIMHHKGLGVRRKNIQKAFQYYVAAAQAGHVPAMYNAAMMQLSGKGTVKSCKSAVGLLKQLAERSPEAAALQKGHEYFFQSDYNLALLSYLEAAEMGMELGQSNAAWLLHRGYVIAGGMRANVTFTLTQRSADQGNVASLLLMADSYLQGEGVDQDWTRSAAVYYDAFQERSAQAMFNLGFMHEFGVGVVKDFKLAKRFYLMAKHAQPEAFLPVQIACLWLNVHEIWDAALPFVPSQLKPFWMRVLSLKPPYTTILGEWGAVVKRLFATNTLLHFEQVIGRLFAFLHIGDLVAMVVSSDEDSDSDSSDITVLVVLVILLLLVLRARNQRAAARAGQAGQVQAGGGGVQGAVPQRERGFAGMGFVGM